MRVAATLTLASAATIAGLLPPELERHRGEVFRGRPHHDSADLAVAGVEDVVEALLEQRRGLLDRSGHDRNRVGVEVHRHQLLDQSRDRRGDLGWLEHCGVAGGEGRNQWREQQLDRVVPRGDDADRAERLGAELCGAGLERQRHLDLPRLRPGVEVLERVVDLVDRERDLRRVRLDAGFAHVGDQRVDQTVLLLDEERPEAAELTRRGSLSRNTPERKPSWSSRTMSGMRSAAVISPD